MGFVRRLFAKTPKLEQPRLSRLQAYTREQTQRQLLMTAVREILTRTGVEADYLIAEGIPGLVTGRGRGMHVQLVVSEWSPNLLPYVVTLEHAVRAHLHLLDPLSSAWMLGLTWRFEPKNPLAWPDFPSSRQKRMSDGSLSVPATAASRKASLESFFQVGNATFELSASADFRPTLPMQYM
jgi:hypothetical protein